MTNEDDYPCTLTAPKAKCTSPTCTWLELPDY